MINYNEYNKSVFKSCALNHDILNNVYHISIQASGSAIEYPHQSSKPSAIVHKVSMYNDSVSFIVSINIPILGINITEEDIGSQYIYKADDSDTRLLMSIDHDIVYHQGVYDVGAEVLLKSFIISPNRKLDVFGCEELSLADGYNSKVSYVNNVLQIIGGAGTGKGKYYGSIHDNNNVPGIRSINGLSDSRNIDISFSDKLITCGASVV